MQLFLDGGVYCEPAMKDRKVGLSGSTAAFHVNPNRPLPQWYLDTQPKERIDKFKSKGSPRIFAFNTCKRWMKEHDDFIWDPVKKNEPKEGQRDDHCFIAGTKVLTVSGEQNIEDLRLGEYVVTRNGLCPIVALGSRDAVVGTAVFSNGRALTGTADHPVWVGNAWRRLDGIRYDDIMVSWPTQKKLYSTVLHSDATQTPRFDHTEFISGQVPTISVEELDIYTKKFGNITMAQYLKATISTTPTRTPLITLKKTWYALQNLSIEKHINLHRLLLTIWRKLDLLQLNGMELALVGDSIRDSMFSAWPRKETTDLLDLAKSAVSHFGQIQEVSSAPIIVSRSGEENSVWILLKDAVEFAEKYSHVTDIAANKPALESAVLVSPWKQKPQKQKVYNITVGGEHEYFANGILVSNCDGTRYHLASNPQPAIRLSQGDYSFRDSDPTSAVHLDQVTKEIQRLTRKDAAARERNSDACDGGDAEPQTQSIQDFAGGYC